MPEKRIPDKRGYFGDYGGRYVPEVLVTALDELEKVYIEAKKDIAFLQQLSYLLSDYVGRPTALYYAERLSKHLGGCKI